MSVRLGKPITEESNLVFHCVLVGIQTPQSPSSDLLRGLSPGRSSHPPFLPHLLSQTCLSLSVVTWTVNVQCFIMTSDSRLSTYCVQEAMLGAVRGAEMNGPQLLSP